MTSKIANVIGYGFVTSDNKAMYVVMFNKLQDLMNNVNTNFSTSCKTNCYGMDKKKGSNYFGTVNNKPSSSSVHWL